LENMFVLYTHQKMKKSKTWQDGILKIRSGSNKAVLFDDKGQCLESIFLKSQVYFVWECFQGPRQVEKKTSTTEEREKTTLPLSKQCEGAFPSKFYGTSPLFSTICQKDAETSASADFREDACTENNSKHMSLSSLLSAPFLDRCEETEKQNPGQSIMRPESPLITGHTKSSSQRAAHGAASHSIRSTAQILALLKSKPAQGCREQTTPQGTQCLSRFQASENTDSLYKRKTTILSAFSGKPAKRLMENIQHLPCTKGICYELLVRCICPTGQEKSNYPGECNLSRVKPPVKTRTPFVTLPATEKIPDTVYSTDSEEIQQPFGSSVVNLCKKSEVFPISAFERQRESVQPAFPNVTSQYRKSKWLKYQNTAQCDLITPNSDGREVTDDICADSLLGMLQGDTGECSSVNKSAPGSAALLTAKSTLGKCSANTSHQDLISERKLLSPHFSQTPLAEATQKVLSHLSCHSDITICELSFPHVDKVKYPNLPKRKTVIPAVFQSHVQYKQIFKAALTEQLNIMLFELSQRFHNALSKVDISFYTSLKHGQTESKESCVPLCHHMHPAKLLVAKKEGQNKGRLFYTCDAPKAEQCSFFKWIEDVNPAQTKSRPSVALHDIKSIGTYLRSQKISLYEECQLLVRKGFEIQTQPCSKFKKLMNTPARFDGDSKTKLYLKLSRKEHYSLYSKDDIWVVSKTLNFDPLDTFIATSAFFGPSSTNEIELLPLKGYCPSNWRSNMFVHALLVCNASGELASLRNMEEHFNPSTLPLIPHLLKMNFDSENATNRVKKSKFTPPAPSLKRTTMYGPISTEVAMGLAKKIIQTFLLNPDQATSLLHIAQMMTSCENTKPVEERQILPITIIRGVFGAGKSYLLSVVILFLVQLFESSEATEGSRPASWKVLIASSTNTAVDRILLCLLNLGFEDFIRVGSIRKITKAILPHSLHAGSVNENDQLKELLALMKEDLTPAEKMYVRRSIEQHKLGTNKTILQQVKVVGVTCAACPFPCLNSLRFPVVILDECSQMTEPASLLPIARFQCEKLVLVGDPKQLPPTIQGSESVHEKGLEQTLFDRLCLMGHKAIVLRTQYRCHPAISAIANDLFYDGNLIDGISEEDRSPLLDWLPTLCFYNVNGVEQTERDNSFYNMPEAYFTVKLTQALIASGIEGSAVGVITLYKSQMCKIQNLLCGVQTEVSKIKAVQVSTVDAFQGAEKEIIVLSCVRTRQIGFIDSEKRMNVALTRARRHLLIVGNLPCLSRNRLWGRVIHHLFMHLKANPAVKKKEPNVPVTI
uniref:5'-3' DNA helicase ZGRF1 n=1 Tax=Strigops habroptila TaxID=2489341 RepID=A0A672UZK8_STRHB